MVCGASEESGAGKYPCETMAGAALLYGEVVTIRTLYQVVPFVRII